MRREKSEKFSVKQTYKIPKSKNFESKVLDWGVSDSFIKVFPLILYTLLIPLFKWRIEYVWSKIAVAYISVALAGVSITYLAVKEKKISFNIPKTAIPFLLLVLLGIISSLWSHNPYRTHHLAVMIGPGFLVYVAVQLLRFSTTEMKIVAFSIATASAIVSGYGVLQLLGVYEMPPDPNVNPNPITTFGRPNFAVEYLLLAFPLTSVLSIAEKGITRWFFLIASSLSFIYIVGAQNRAGWVGTITFFLSFGVIYALHKVKEGYPLRVIMRYAFALVLAIAILLTLFMAFTDYGRKIAGRFKSFVVIGPGSSVTTRLLAWDAGLNMIAENPVLGVGAGNFEVWKYASRLLDEIMASAHVRGDNAHNEYLQIFAELGIIGLSLFITVLLIIFKLYIDIFWRGGSSYEFFLGTGLFLGTFSLLSSASFNFSLQWPGSVTHFWLYVGILELIHSKVMGRELFELDMSSRPALSIFPGLFIFVGAMGAPCFDGIPFCKEGPCIVRKICISSPGFFTARNLALAEIYYITATFYHGANILDTAEKFYLASLRHENPSERTYYNLARLYLQKNRGILDRRIIGLFEEVLNLAPDFGRCRRELGRMYVDLGNVRKGIEYLLRSTDSNPAGTPEAYAYTADAYIRIGDYESALKYAKMAIDEIENSPLRRRYGLSQIPPQIFDERKVRWLSYFVMGSAYAHLQRYDEAEKYLKMSLELGGNDPRILQNLYTVYMNQGRYEEAEKVLNRIRHYLPSP